MKRITYHLTIPHLLAVLLFGTLAATAQQRPHYSQYLLNNYILNPALSGIERYTDVKLSHRHQWVGLADAPVTTYFTIHGPIGKSDDRGNALSFETPGDNPRGQAYWESYTAAEPHHGIGLTVVNDRTGALNQFTTYATYAYHMGLSPTTNLAAGIGLGGSMYSLDRTRLTPENPNDPSLGNNQITNRFRPDINVGLWLYSGRFFAGLSAQQIIPQKITFANDGIERGGKAIPHVFGNIGYRAFLSSDWSLIPNLMVKWADPVPPQVDVNARAMYQDRFWIGATYRGNYGFAAMTGINVSSKFNIGYSYDYSTTRLNTVSRGTHEIVLGFLLNNRYGDTCPRNLW